MSRHLLVITTVGSDEEAAELGRGLVEKKLVACVNVVGPVRSFYTWKGQLQDDSERLLFMKTRADRFNELELAVRELHPYEVPELIAVPIERGAASYLSWVDANVGKVD